ncbi:hypothetical protein [Desulfogranum mediterraneum]|uniref:hypothetical protein n=1 Tax=Desulfogranum mediterraneum TaxID=160661 RepID=UPI00041BB0B7|nr:hypothetical protein [Desulfogranum mediterraneum]
MTQQQKSAQISPREHLQAMSQRYPSAWKDIDLLRQERDQNGPDWPDWCFCPLACSHGVLSQGSAAGQGQEGDVATVAGLAGWRVSQSVYRFDPALSAALAATSIRDVPSEVLYRLPEWCVYLEALNLTWMGRRLTGFFVHLERDAKNHRSELRLLLACAGAAPGELVPVTIPLDQGTLGSAVEATLNGVKEKMLRHAPAQGAEAMAEQAVQVMADGLQPLLSLVVYLCSDQVDLVGEQPGRPEPVKTKKGWKFFPPETPLLLEVGYASGQVLRSARQAGGPGAVKPVKAHWRIDCTAGEPASTAVRWMGPLPPTAA